MDHSTADKNLVPEEDKPATPDELCMQLVAYAGAAKSSYIGALRAARKHEREQAEVLLGTGDKQYQKACSAHLELLARSAQADSDVQLNFLLLHAEDQLSNAETFQVLAREFLDEASL